MDSEFLMEVFKRCLEETMKVKFGKVWNGEEWRDAKDVFQQID